MRKLLTIEGMSCGHCVKRVKTALSDVKGVTNAEVDLAKKSATVEGNELDEIALRAAVTEAGYEVTEVLDD